MLSLKDFSKLKISNPIKIVGGENSEPPNVGTTCFTEAGTQKTDAMNIENGKEYINKCERLRCVSSQSFNVFTVFLCVLCLFLLGCRTASSVTSKTSYRLDFVQGDYKLSIDKLCKKIEQEESIYWADAYNLVALSDNYNVESGCLVKAIEVLASHGVDEGFFIQRVSGFSESDKFYKSFISGKELFSNSYNSSYDSLLNTLLVIDQQDRTNKSRYERYIVDSLNFVSFLDLYGKFGFPKLKDVGLDVIVNDEGRYVLNEPKFYVLFTHFSLQQFEPFYDILLSISHEGDINPSRLIRWVGAYNKYKFLYPNPILKINGKYYIEKNENLFIDSSNMLRIHLNLPSFEDQVECIKYKINKSKEDDIILPFTYISLSLPEEVIDKYLIEIK